MHGWTNTETWRMASQLDNVESDYIETQRMVAAYAPHHGGQAGPRTVGNLARALKTRFGGAFGDAVNWREIARELLDEHYVNGSAVAL